MGALWKKHIPNMLAIIRLAFCWLPLVLLLTAQCDNSLKWKIIALLAFAVLAITDLLDGWLARRWKACSKLGEILDPIADKSLVILTLIGIITTTPIFYSNHFGGIELGWGLVIFIVATEIATIAGRPIKRAIRRRYRGDQNVKLAIPANGWGKTKTVMQMAGMIIAFIPHKNCEVTALVILLLSLPICVMCSVTYIRSE